MMTADKFGVKGKCLVLLDSSEKACDQYSSSWSIVRGRDLSAGKGNIVEALLDEDTLTFTRLYSFSQLELVLRSEQWRPAQTESCNFLLNESINKGTGEFEKQQQQQNR